MDYRIPNKDCARKHRVLLGLQYIDQDVFEEILTRAFKEYKRFDNIMQGLTWAEFIVVTAYRMGYKSQVVKIEEMAEKWKYMAMMGGFGRKSALITEYLSWDGWVTIPK